MKLVFRFGRYKLNTFTNPKLKVKNFLSFSVSYIFAIIIIIIIIIAIAIVKKTRQIFITKPQLKSY